MTNRPAEVVGESYFHVDVDRELYALDSEDQQGMIPLSWRGHPEKTFSDWRIIVVTKSHKPKTFYVHRAVLSNGTRASKYFSKLFSSSKATTKNLRSKSIVSNGTSTKIELEERDAKNFPDMLDFIYADASLPSMSSDGTASAELSNIATSPSFQMRSNSSLEGDHSISLGEGINTNNAVSLRHLSRLLDCEAITLAINKFIQRDLSFKTGPIYFKHADEYKDERLAEATKRLCTDNFDKISMKSLMRLPIHLMKELVDTVGCDTAAKKGTSLVLSEIVYLYIERHPEHLNPTNLLDLTEKIPKIGPEPAIGFTALARDLDPEATAVHWERLVDLCKRCSDAVVLGFGWTDFSVESALSEYLRSVSQSRRSQTDSLLFATSFAAALQQAQCDHAEAGRKQEKLETMVHELQKAISQRDKQLAAQKLLAEELKRQILHFKKKLSTAKQK